MAEIVYTGTIYDKQDVSRIFKALRELGDEGVIDDSMKLVFYGSDNDRLLQEAKAHGVTERLVLHGRVSREEVLEAQRNADVLLLLKWESPKENGVIPMKLFEYMATGIPVLATGGHYDEVSKILERTRIGICAETEEEVKMAITRVAMDYGGFKGGKDAINREG